MRRRGLGIAGLQKTAQAKEQYKEAGNVLASTQLEQLKEQLETFKSNLEDYARKHKNEISKNPVFRNHFQEMCSKIGVDPLQCKMTGFWSDILGVGDFYYELGVQIVEICMQLKEKTGGYVEMHDLRKRLSLIRSKKTMQEITQEDIIRSIKALKPLGSGFDLIKVGATMLIQSVPREANTDHVQLLECAQSLGWFSENTAQEKLKWSAQRLSNAIVV